VRFVDAALYCALLGVVQHLVPQVEDLDPTAGL
jgi:hypothetical protein